MDRGFIGSISEKFESGGGLPLVQHPPFSTFLRIHHLLLQDSGK
jgi:hypothetical protein